MSDTPLVTYSVELLEATINKQVEQIAWWEEQCRQQAARIAQLEAALRRAYGFLQDKSFMPDELTRECTKVLEVMEAALAPEQEK